jgi:hypothetical protein
MTGSVPGMPMQIGQTRVFGSSGSPGGGPVGHAQNIFDAVRSWACTSIPMTVSYRIPTAMAAIVGNTRCGIVRRMKIGEWDNLGRARELLQRQLGDLGAAEYAAHVTVNEENGRLRVFVATDVGLLDYSYAPVGANVEGSWILRGQLHRWASVRGLRLQTDAQIDEANDESKSIWRLVAEDPKIELTASTDTGERAIDAMLAFARSCIQHAA